MQAAAAHLQDAPSSLAWCCLARHRFSTLLTGFRLYLLPSCLGGWSTGAGCLELPLPLIASLVLPLPGAALLLLLPTQWLAVWHIVTLLPIAPGRFARVGTIASVGSFCMSLLLSLICFLPFLDLILFLIQRYHVFIVHHDRCMGRLGSAGWPKPNQPNFRSSEIFFCPRNTLFH